MYSNKYFSPLGDKLQNSKITRKGFICSMQT